MIVTLDKNKKLRLTYDGRSYIIHNNDNHYYIMKDNEKIYCTKEVKEYYKKTKQSQQPKSQPITHTLQTFEMNGNKYAIEKLNKNYCVRRNGMYICTNEVNEIVKQIYGGVPVNIEPEYNESNPNSYRIKNPKFERFIYDIRKRFINNLEVYKKSDGSLLIQTIKAKNGIIYYYPLIIYKKSNGDIITFKVHNLLSSGSYGITGLMKPTIQDPSTDSYYFVIKIFTQSQKDPSILNEINVVEDLYTRKLFTESTYAKVLEVPEISQKYILMELAQGDLYQFYQLNYIFLLNNPCNAVKLIYAIFHEVYNIFKQSEYLHADIKLENFLYTNELDSNGNNILHVIMADYGSLGKLNSKVFIKNADGSITSSGIAITYRKYVIDDWINNWENVAFNLGCSILICLSIIRPNYYKYTSPSDLLNDIPNIFNNLIGMPNERILIAALLGIKIINDSTPSVRYELVEPDEILDTPEKIKEVFKTYKINKHCNLLEIDQPRNKAFSIRSCVGKLCGNNYDNVL